MKLSVIIPAYNCEQYIDETIGSVLSQLPEDCEVVVVDDGSTDGTAEHLLRWRDREEVQLLFCEHRGASAARNAGIDAAKGERIAFLDCDDQLCRDFLPQSLPFRDDADLYIFGIERIHLDGSRECWTVSDAVYPDVSDFADDYIRNRHLLIYSPSNKIYKRSIIERCAIRFEEGLSFGEDRLFNYRYLMGCGRVITSQRMMFRYLERSSESLSTRHVPDLFSLVMRLHREKMKCFFSLSKSTTQEERVDFSAYDCSREIENTIVRFAGHPEERDENLPAINAWIFGSFSEPDQPVNVLIVLGSTNCEYRIEKAFDIGRNIPDVRYIVSGGNRYKDGKRTEAKFMYDYLCERGVPPQRIYLEDKARYSSQNLEYCGTILKAIRRAEQNGAGVERPKRTGIVTAGFHLPRIQLMAERSGAFSGEKLAYYPAYGPRTAPDVWYRDPEGRNIVLDEFRKTIRFMGISDDITNT